MKIFKHAALRSAVYLMSVLSIGVLATGCKDSENAIIRKVIVKPSESLEVIRVALVFGKDFKSNLQGGWAVKNYGYLFVNPYTSKDEPFEVGFDLNTSVFTENDYVSLTPTTVYPNGVSMGLPHAVVEIRGQEPISPYFDLYGYVDVLHQSWIGAAGMVYLINDKYFPAGLSTSVAFLRDDEGNPGVIGTIFGPELNEDGSMKRSGGVAVLANVRQLMQRIKSEGQAEITLLPEGIIP